MAATVVPCLRAIFSSVSPLRTLYLVAFGVAAALGAGFEAAAFEADADLAGAAFFAAEADVAAGAAALDEAADSRRVSALT